MLGGSDEGGAAIEEEKAKSGYLAMTICVCKYFQVRPHPEANLGSVIDERMLKSKKRVHDDARHCHESALHATTEQLFN
jgi:hypothetical protein